MAENSSTRFALTTFSPASFRRYASTDVEDVLSEADRDANTLIHVVHAGVSSSTRIFDHFGLPHHLAEQIEDATAPELDTSADGYLFRRFRFIEEQPDGPSDSPRTTEPGVLIRGAETDRFMEGAGCLILGEKYVLLLEESDGSPLIARALESVLRRERDLRERGIEYLLHRLAKALFVDNYSKLMRRLLDRLQELEEPLLEGSADPAIYREVARLRRELNPFERSLLQAAEFTSELSGDGPTARGALSYLAGRLGEGCERLEKEFSMLRDRTSELIETYRDNVNTQLNNIMRSLTVISVMFLPLSFIAGFYGMNFPNMPAVRWAGGFPLAVLLMLAILVGSLTYARRKKWI